MENNDSPYIYEKPLRSENKKRTKRLAGLSTLGLIGLVGIFGGSAIAKTLVSASAETPVKESDALEVVEANPQNLDAPGDQLISAASVEPISDPAALVSIPLQQVKPKPNSQKIDLPGIPDQSFGNTSSATPSVGSGSYSASGGSAKFEARGERHDKYESRDDDHDDDHDEEHEDD